MTLDDSHRQDLIQHKLEKANETIADVKFLIEHDKLTIAVNRSYYGMFYVLSALALKHRFTTTKHKQLIGWFNKTFVKTNRVDRKFGEIIHNAFDQRSKSDYDDFVTFSKDEVDQLFEEMKAFIHAIEKLIEMEDG